MANVKVAMLTMTFQNQTNSAMRNLPTSERLLVEADALLKELFTSGTLSSSAVRSENAVSAAFVPYCNPLECEDGNSTVSPTAPCL